MSLRSVNLDAYSLSLLAAKEDILNPRSSINWVIFAYDGITDNLKLADSGAGGVAELAGKFHISKPQYGLCKVGSVETGAPQIAMISWVGEHVEEYRRTECASHVPAIKHFFKEAHVFIGAEKAEDVTEERIRTELNKALAQAPAQWARRSSRSADKEELVGTNYRKTNAAMEMRRINRESFWARAEREEEERKDEERKRTAEERRRLEKERILKERRDAEERDRKMNEKLQMIEEQRRKQAAQEEEMRRKEKLRWEQQQREHSDDMRARLRRSESIEKAAEAAALVSQRSMNPREFFRQLSSSSSPPSKSPTSPGSSRTGKPFRRYQRSLTDTAFIFSKAEECAASSPRSPPLVSPFSRALPSPSYHAATSPTSPDFGPVSSPRHVAPVSPPASPLRPSPPASAPPSHPQTNDQVQAVVEPKPPSSAGSSVPPASLGLLVSLSPKLTKNSQSQANPDTLPASPPNTPTQPEDSTFCFEPVHSPQAPAARLPEVPPPNADLDAMPELVSDIGYKAQAVLVEEDEEEDEEGDAGEVAEAQPQPRVASNEAIQTEAEEPDGEEEDPEEEERKEEGLKEEGEDASVEVLVEDVQEEEGAEEDPEQTVQSVDNQAPAETAESAATDAEPVCQEVKHESAVPSTNGITNGENTQEQNGTERSLSPSDTELSSPEPVVCSSPHGRAEEDGVEDKDQEIFKNGQEVLAAQQVCVRALYDYQAEDESEISFEPGDIIRDVETVDKAWWKGWSKDGRQGLFPANYVETI